MSTTATCLNLVDRDNLFIIASKKITQTISNQIKSKYVYLSQESQAYILFRKLETGGGGIDSQGMFNTQPPPHWRVSSSYDADLKRWMVDIMVFMGWRELQTQFINVQESVKERSGTFILGVEHIKINES